MSTEWRILYLELWRQEDNGMSTEWRIPYLELWRQEDNVNKVE